jgi:hypothetical protein
MAAISASLGLDGATWTIVARRLAITAIGVSQPST